MKKRPWVLFVILFIATVLRLWNLGGGDTLSDEVLYSFRAIGMLDFDEAADQTTPLEWLDPSASSGQVPWWTKLSFHDHPPLVFAIQHIFMRIFGETTFAFRLPSALLGIASVYILYYIGRYLYSENAGLLAAAIFGVTINNVVISRLGLQEAYVIFFMLLAIYFFLKAAEYKRYYYGVGVVIGLALLTKYTAGIIIPIFLTHMVLFRRNDFYSRQVWIGGLFAVLLFSPVVLYNIHLYKNFGHFDFQISYIIGQNPDVWPVAPGKEEFPTLTSRISAFLPNIIKFNSWVFLLLFGISVFGIFWQIKKHYFLLISLFWLLVLIFFFIGPSMRFLSLLTSFMALGIGAYISGASFPLVTKRSVWVALLIVLLFELTYSFNSQLLPYPKGPELWAWSSVRYENYNWGYEELDKWMREKTSGRMPALAFEPKYHFIENIHKEALAKAEREGKKPLPTLFVYDKNIQSIAQLWTLDRLQIYHAWPIIPADNYVQFLENNGEAYFKNAGFKEIYYVFPTNTVPWKKTHLTTIGPMLKDVLTNSGIEVYTALENKRGDTIFYIYRKEL